MGIQNEQQPDKKPLTVPPGPLAADKGAQQNRFQPGNELHDKKSSVKRDEHDIDEAEDNDQSPE